MTLRAPAACLAAIALLAAAGCGEISKEDYEEEVDAIGRTLEEQVTAVGRGIQASGGIENAEDEIDKGADAIEQAASDLDEVEPPDDAAAAHDRLVAGLRDIAADFRAAAKAARRGERRALLELVNGVESSDGARRLESARRLLRDKGYAVEG